VRWTAALCLAALGAFGALSCAVPSTVEEAARVPPARFVVITAGGYG